MFKRSVVWVLLLSVAAFSGRLPAARGQSETTLRELRRLHDRLADPQRVLSRQDARQARDRLAEWRLDPAALSPDDRARLWRIELYAALAEGAAGAALERARQLWKVAPDDPGTAAAVHLAACAAGDAQLALRALARLAEGADSRRRRWISRQRRWLRRVGEKAPDVVIRTEDMTEFSTARRGDRVLVLDFWNTRLKPDEEQIAALRGLFDEYRRSLHIELVGINADSETRAEQARQFAKEHGFVWKQRYEYQARGAPLTHGAFHAGNPPWVVLIDTFGYVRAVGAAYEPAFQYALRAAVAEAGGAQQPLLPRTHTGQQAERPGAAAEAAAPSSEQPAPELPSNPEALQKLRLARTYLKTGKRSEARRLFEEIVRNYPGTREAREAQEYLEALGGP